MARGNQPKLLRPCRHTYYEMLRRAPRYVVSVYGLGTIDLAVTI